MNVKPLYAVLPVLLLFLFILACPAPLETEKLQVLQDLNPPIIIVDSPAQGSLFRSTVTVSGSILDIDADKRERSHLPGSFIRTAGYHVLNEDLESTPIAVDEDGGFGFTLPCTGYDKPIVLQITAEDLNGNAAAHGLTLNPNTRGPHIVITSPEDYSIYKTEVVLTGTVCNGPDDPGLTETVPRISYELPGTTAEGTAELDEEGRFSLVLDTADYDSRLLCRISAEDLNGNISQASLTLIPDETGPFVEISSPADYSVFESTVTVTGRAANSAGDGSLTEVVSPLVYELPGTSESGTVELEEDGSFTFDLDTMTWPWKTARPTFPYTPRACRSWI